MTQENKELLLKDLCARLPYRTLISIDGDGNRYRMEEISHAIIGINTYKTTVENCNIEQVKPYLLPLSSMTEEQKNTIDLIASSSSRVLSDVVDFYNKYHLDWRGLIPKGLAIDATGLNIY